MFIVCLTTAAGSDLSKKHSPVALMVLLHFLVAMKTKMLLSSIRKLNSKRRKVRFKPRRVWRRNLDPMRLYEKLFILVTLWNFSLAASLKIHFLFSFFSYVFYTLTIKNRTKCFALICLNVQTQLMVALHAYKIQF